MIIAIDGPAGAGKSTVAKILAAKLKFIYIDTGAMYRALALKALETKTDISDTTRLIEIARTTNINLINNHAGALHVLMDGRDVSADIRHPRVTKLVSDVAKIKEIREVMLKLQRSLGAQKDCILDGRDIGTVVFPDADKKFYLDAKVDERVKRRHKELNESGTDISLGEVSKDVKNRDTIDSSREFAPLKKAPDAIYLDTTDLAIDEVVERMLAHIHG